jgi:ABC-2 type transport system ATP-binding protein
MLVAENLVKRFEKLIAVDHVSLSLGEGRCLALLGPNGAGKTTTVEMLEGLSIPDSGSVQIFGKSWNAARREILENIGVQLQETNLYKKLTVRETWTLFGSFYKTCVSPTELATQLQLTDKLDVRLEKLSGGQKQRCYLGCAILNRPKLVFLDEPTTGLDPQARRQIWDLVRSWKRSGTSILLTTHYMEEAERLADDVAVIDHGKIIAHGSTHELVLKHCGRETLVIETDNVDIVAGSLPASSNVVKGDGRIEISFNNDGDAIQTMSNLSASNDDVRKSLHSMQIRRSTLEDVFLKITGRNIRDA